MANLTKAYVQPIAGDDTSPIEVLFNPAEYSLERGNHFQASALPGLSNPMIQFVNGNADTLTMDLFFDTYTDDGGSDVTKLTRRFSALMEIDSSLHAPPPVRFIWGKFQFQAVVERINEKFTMFLNDGTPVRATLNVTFKEYRTIQEQLEDAPRKSADRTQYVVFTDGDALWLIASRLYGDKSRWDTIARESGIEDPRDIEVGTEIVVPPVN